MRLKELGEDPFIRELAQRFGSPHPRIIKAIGDDTSVTKCRPGRVLLTTTDTLVEGTHFKLTYTNPYLLGRKSLSVSISDIAAMGGEPLFFLVSLTVPANMEKRLIDDLYKGMLAVSSKYGPKLVGGNTSSTRKGMVVSTTLLGEAQSNKVVYRRGARPGDIICITGTVGDSALGLKILKKYGPGALKGPFGKAARKHLDPTPRLEAGRALAAAGLATAMIDISDGVLLDLERLSRESSTGAVLEAARLPLSATLKRHIKSVRLSTGLTLALTGGEDYELLFTTRPEHISRINSLSKRLRLPITPVGKIVKKSYGVVALGQDGRKLRIKKAGYEHF